MLNACLNINRYKTRLPINVPKSFTLPRSSVFTISSSISSSISSFYDSLLYSPPQSPGLYGICSQMQMAIICTLFVIVSLHACAPETVNLNNHIGVLTQGISSTKGLYNNSLFSPAPNIHTHTHIIQVPIALIQ